MVKKSLGSCLDWRHWFRIGFFPANWVPSSLATSYDGQAGGQESYGG